MKSINTGAPHFRSVAKQHRHANYTLDKVINEAVDNVIKKATNIFIKTIIDDTGRLQELKISDNYIDGFDNIDCEGTACPLNMGHMREGHDCDDETSEFGVGLKAGALNAGNKLEVITRVGKTGECIKVLVDFQRMINEPDVNDSYNPVMREASLEEYGEYHPFDSGSSIIISQIRENICKATTLQQITQDILIGVSNTYSRLISNAHKIFVNGVIVEKEHDLFADPKCALFNIKKDIIMLLKGSDIKILMRKTVKTTTWQEFNCIDDKWGALPGGGEKLDDYLRDGYKYMYAEADGSCIKVETTFTRFSDDPANLTSASDYVHIYKDRRKYNKKLFVKHNDGYDNYTAHKIDFKAKQIGKILGITYNKEITMDGNNNLINSLKAAVSDNRKEFINKPSSPKYCALFEKALGAGVIHWKTCKPDLIPDKLKYLRDDYDRSSYVIEPALPAREPDKEPTRESNKEPDKEPVIEPALPDKEPVIEPALPDKEPDKEPIIEPTREPNKEPDKEPIIEPTREPNKEPDKEPIIEPTREPNKEPDKEPNKEPTREPNKEPTREPNKEPTREPNKEPDKEPVIEPTREPNKEPVIEPDKEPVIEPDKEPVIEPDKEPVIEPDKEPVIEPDKEPTREPALSVIEPALSVIEPTLSVIEPTREPALSVIEPDRESETFVKQYCQYLMNELANGLISTKSLDEVKTWMIASIKKN